MNSISNEIKNKIKIMRESIKKIVRPLIPLRLKEFSIKNFLDDRKRIVLQEDLVALMCGHIYTMV